MKKEMKLTKEMKKMEEMVKSIKAALDEIQLKIKKEEETKMKNVEEMDIIEKDMEGTINSYDLNKRINEYRARTNLRTEQNYGNFVKTIKNYEKYFEELGTKYTKMRLDGHVRKVYVLNMEGVNLLIDLTSNSDKIPLQEVYEELGGDVRIIHTINRPEDEFMRDLHEALNEIDIKFIREKIIGKYRVDGFIDEYNLVIEYDDDYHFSPAQRCKDKKRESELRQLGYEVIRLDYKDSNAKNIGKVIKQLIK